MINISLIVAMDLERGIGRNNDLMWHLPADMHFFKETTKGHVVIMGRKNFDSIPEKYRPLPGRQNVILTRNRLFQAENCLVFHSLNDSFSHFKDEKSRKLFIIGGGEVYRLALESDQLTEMFITTVNKVYGADTFFPEFDEKLWEKSKIGHHKVDDQHEVDFTFWHYKKIKSTSGV